MKTVLEPQIMDHDEQVVAYANTDSSSNQSFVDRLAYGRGFVPPVRIFGCLFLIVAIVFAVAGFKYGESFGITLGAICAVVGLVMALGCYGVMIDKRLNAVFAWYGILVPLYRRHRAWLDSFTRVVLTSQYHRGDQDRMHYTEYVVSLCGNGTSTQVDAFREDLPRARRRCEQLAKFLDFPIYDQKEEGKTIIRQVAELDESLAQRVRRTGEQVHVPPKPDGCVIKDFEENGKAVFQIPPSGFGLGEVIIMSFAGVALVPILAALVLFVFRPETLGLPLSQFVMLMCSSVVPIVLICFALMSAARSERVTLSAHDIRLEYLGRSKRIKTVAVIPASEVEELELCKSTERQGGDRVIAIRSDRVTIEFGGSLQSEEQEWLYATLWTALTANQEKD